MEKKPIDPTEVSEVDDINSIKIKNIEKIVSSYNDRFDVINKLFIRTKTFMEDIVTSVLTKRVENVENNIDKIIKVIEGHTEELKGFETKFKEIFKVHSDMTLINDTIKRMGDDISNSRERLIESLEELSKTSSKGKDNESSIAKLNESYTDLSSKIKTINNNNEPVLNSINAAKMLISFIKIAAAVSVGIFAIVKSLVYLKKENIFDVVEFFKSFC